jgi:ABC-type transport system substrate-binding protein
MFTKIIKKIRNIITFFLLISFCLLPLERNNSKQKPQYGGVFRVKSFADQFRRQLDPIKSDSFIFLSEQLYDGLVRLDKNFNIVPSLAEYWEISPDGEKYTFHLRKGVLFHDGEELTAEDVKYSLERILDKKNDSPYFHYFLSRVLGAEEFRSEKAEHVSGFKAQDKYTFEIHWVKPYVSALYLMSMHFCKILPKEMSQIMGDRFFFNPSGTGPFAFEHWLRDTRLNIVGVCLKRNENYFMGKPYLEAVEFCSLYKLDNFLREEIDSIPLISNRLFDSKYQIFEDGSINIAFLGMSCNIAPLNRPDIRKAISLGIDKNEIIRQLDEPQLHSSPASRFFPRSRRLDRP